WQTGGLLFVTNATVVGFLGVGQMTISNGTWLTSDASGVVLGGGGSARGTLNIAGGTNSIPSSLVLGTSDCAATGIVSVTGGELRITNSLANALLLVESGTLSISGGLVEINTIILSNSCAHFSRTGGTLIYGTATLDPNRDEDADGISNGYEQSH